MMVRILARFIFFASSSRVCSSWRSMWTRDGQSSSMTTFGCTLRITSDTSRWELSLKCAVPTRYTLAPSGVVSTVTVSGRCRSNSSSEPYTGISGSAPPAPLAVLSIGISDTLAVVSRESRSPPPPPPPVVTVSDVSVVEDCDMLMLTSAGLGRGLAAPVGPSVSSSSEELTNERVTLFAVSEALRSRLSVLAVVFSALLVLLLLLLLASPTLPLPLPAVCDCGCCWFRLLLRRLSRSWRVESFTFLLCRARSVSFQSPVRRLTSSLSLSELLSSLLESIVELSVVSSALLYSDDELNGEDIFYRPFRRSAANAGRQMIATKLAGNTCLSLSTTMHHVIACAQKNPSYVVVTKDDDDGGTTTRAAFDVLSLAARMDHTDHGGGKSATNSTFRATFHLRSRGECAA
uniref:Secreted peptide n=1 Tax=Anopheles braziliensis TaxID=58242 RepID=A0A2M3ZLL3_9DIPT